MAESAGKIAFNGNGRSAMWGKVRAESGAFAIAEGASIATGLGVVAVADRIIPASILNGAANAISKVAVEPFLDHIEAAKSYFCKLEECQVDPTKTRSERAHDFAKTLTVFGVAWAASMAVKLATRRKVNEAFGIIEKLPGELHAGASLWEKVKYYSTFQWVTPEEKLIFGVDEGLHYGSMWLMNSHFAPATDNMIRCTSQALQNLTGVDERKAHDVSSMFWIWDAPNIIGALGGIGVIAGNHAMGLSTKGPLGKLLANKLPAEPITHVQKLAQRNAVPAPHSLH